MAYRRLLDWYYTDEKPLMLDIGKVCRKVIATTEAQRAAVETVLEEFFVKTDDGWRHLRADEELESMQEKQAASGEREEHEKTRMQKHRERRSAMFAQLSEVGVYPAWNAKTGEIERLISEHCGQPVTPPVTTIPEGVTAPVTAPVTAATSHASLLQRPATAIPTPTPTPTPVINTRAKALSSPAKLPTCQGKAIIDLYHEVLPELPAVRLETKDRVRAMRKMWDWVLTSEKPDHTRRAETPGQALAWFRAYFERARENEFLMGVNRPVTGEHANWRCDLDFLLTERGMKQVIEKTQLRAVA